jgi:hypothetical protein
MKRIAFACLFLVLVVVFLPGCSRSRKEADENLGKNGNNKKKDAPASSEKKDADKAPPKQVVVPDGGDKGHADAATALVGSWKATFVVDDEAFETFVEANMLSEDLSKSEKERWNDSSISIVLNSDGSCVYTEPDGNFYNATWNVSAVEGDRVNVAIKARDETKTATLVMNEDGNGFSCEFVDDAQYDFLPIKKPLAFGRE